VLANWIWEVSLSSGGPPTTTYTGSRVVVVPLWYAHVKRGDVRESERHGVLEGSGPGVQDTRHLATSS